ncbi:hypothetical protein D0469_08580 [Peribacillus saganii]|uniref:Uncharacterized protein n=1 Tax=Peribacillus saganii TaxID=2303992 RepID=A0A372LQK3_9BACI|nr:hypothetical protein [Peribacillus saganii]RFU69855.1 hypothetical protein D0469_08580 [Peribacillus saganii]
MRNSKNSLLGMVALGAAAYMFRNKQSRDKVMSKVSSILPQDARNKVMDKVRSFKGSNTGASQVKHHTPAEFSAPNSQALSTADTMNEQSARVQETNSSDNIKKVEVMK